ncbi:hypothetical protein [Parabacteroides chinchillae]
MKRNLLNFALSFMFISLFSCQNDDILDDSALNSGIQTRTTNEEINEIKFLYKGVLYSSQYQIAEDSTFIFSNKDVDNIANTLKGMPNLVTFVYPSGIIEYFDDPLDMDNRLNLEKTYDAIQSLTSTKAINLNAYTQSGHLITYEDSKCKGKKIHSYINHSTQIVGASYEFLKQEGMNDKISSIDLTCDYITNYVGPNKHGNKCIAIFYEDPEYQGYALSFSVDPNYPHSYIHYFKSYPLYPGSSKNWNDRISSYRFSFDWTSN